MKILTVGVVRNEQLKRLQEEAKKREHQVDGCYVSQLVIHASKKGFVPSLRGKSLEDYNLIYFWAVGKKRWEWYSAGYYLNKTKGTIIVNNKVISPSYKLYLSPAMNYMKQVNEGISFPESAILFDEKSVDSVIDNFSFPLILKAAQGRQGRGVFKIDSKMELVTKLRKLSVEKKAFVIREFIPNDGDIRIFTVGYKAIGAMKRIPTDPKEFRSNISLGGRGENYDLKTNPKVKEIAEKLSEITRTEIAGVDIMIHKETGEPYILEINPGPQFTGFEKYTGINAAEKIVKYFEKLRDNNK